MSTISAAHAKVELKPMSHAPLVGPRADATQLDALLARELPALRALRRDLHQHPELSYQEHRTSAIVARELRACGADVKTGWAKGTGVVGYLPATDAAGDARGSVGLRADMDALPIDERTGTPYCSTTPGVMHACGHDGHTTMLLGAAKILSSMPRPSPVTFIFQPAEEGGGGAEVMCAEGALEGNLPNTNGRGLGAPVRAMFGLHGWPTIEVGRVATRVGPLLAATDDFEVVMRGTQAHGAYPHVGQDAILASAHAITQLQSIVARNMSPLDSCVVTVGAVHAGTADNIIPETCSFIGTIRTLRDQTRALAKRRFFEIIEHGARSMGCAAQITWKPGYPVTCNDANATHAFFAVARDALGTAVVDTVEHPTMGGEDFAYFGQLVPSCFFLLGLRPIGADTYPTLHQPDFDFNDDALPVGVRMMCELALRA